MAGKKGGKCRRCMEMILDILGYSQWTSGTSLNITYHHRVCGCDAGSMLDLKPVQGFRWWIQGATSVADVGTRVWHMSSVRQRPDC
eukprot:s3806_g7.t1